MNFSGSELVAMVGQYMWVFARIGAMVAVAPIFGTRTVPARVKIIITLVISATVVPVLGQGPAVEPFSFAGLLVLAQEILIGALIGFSVSLVFDALITGGQIIAQLMGLGFASMMDPQNGVSVPVVGQFYTVMATLIFLAMNGHLLLIELVVSSFQSLPIGVGLSRESFMGLALWGKWVFIGALMVALPAIVALLVVNIAFGVMTRAAPQLNIFAVGFPITIMFGFVVMVLTLPNFVTKFQQLLDELFSFLRQLS